MLVQAFDGERWSEWDLFTITTTNAAPVATINDHSVARNQWIQIDEWLTYSDADGHAATQYRFRDGGSAANSGYFWTPGNAHHPAGTDFTVSVADLANVWVRGGAVQGSEVMLVSAFDGNAWSEWDTFAFLTM